MINTFKYGLIALSKWLAKIFDFSDIVGFAGLGGVFYGLYQHEPALAYGIVGGIVFCLAVITSVSKKRD